VDYQRAVAEAGTAGLAARGCGSRRSGVPGLDAVDPNGFGLAFVTIDGAVFGFGDHDQPFSAQSITKLFALALVVAHDGEALWRRVGYRPTTSSFNSLSQLEIDGGIPENPYVNAGALVVTDRLRELDSDAALSVRNLIRAEAGNDGIESDERLAAAERNQNHRNTALAYLLMDFGALRNPVAAVLDDYYRQCAITASCVDLARAGLFLAQHGVRRDGSRMLSRSQAKQLNALTMIAGMYDGMAEIAYRIGLPAKSGVGGGVLAVIPGVGTLCGWSPLLDNRGNSTAVVAALEAFTTTTGLSVF
jgi:glutaminase